MSTSVVRRRMLAVVAAASLGAIAVSAAPAAADPLPESGGTVRVLLTPEEREAACGKFQGSYIFSDGSTLDCSTGIATIPEA